MTTKTAKQTENPLKDTDPTIIEELLSRDPLFLTEEDVDKNTSILVVALRAERTAWEREKAKAKITGKKLSGQTTKKAQKAEVLKKIRENPAQLSLSAILGKPEGSKK